MSYRKKILDASMQDGKERGMLKVFGVFVPLARLSLGLAELSFIGAALYFVLVPVLVTAPNLYPVAAPALLSIILSAIGFLMMLAVGLYKPNAFQNYRATATKTLLAFGLMVPMIFVVVFALKRAPGGSFAGISAGWYVKAIVIWFICIVGARVMFMHLMRLAAIRRRIVVLGTGTYANQIRQMGSQSFATQFTPVAFVRSSHEKVSPAGENVSVEFDSAGDEFLAFVRSCRASEVVVATDDRRGLPTHQLLRCKIAGIRVTDYLSFCERESGRVDLKALQPSWLIYSDGFRTGALVRIVKRSFDILASFGVLILTLPVLVATALMIAIESKGPILYRQERVGLQGKIFTLLKFRSMQVDAEEGRNPQWAATQDPRVTRVGTWIRKVRIDELPQLINVLKGEMSFIGPRPERPYFVEQLAKQIPFYNERHSVKPGISGWAQINYPYGASLEDARKKLEFDLFYVKNTTLLVDFVILLRTIGVILYPEGAR
jgi:sugar transferase (PEP-CTERM system associated)